MKRSYKIEPLKPRLGKWEIGTFDIETVPIKPGESALIGKFAHGATCMDHAGSSIVYWDNACDMLRYMLAFYNRVRWFAHNGGRFDFKYIIDDECLSMVLREGYQIKPIGSDIVKGLLFTHTRSVRRLMICDSSKLMPSSLAELCTAFDVETPKGFIDFDKENYDKTNDLHREYLKNDVVSLWQVVTAYRRTFRGVFGVEPKCTASSSAFEAFRYTLKETIYRHSDEVDTFCRMGYYGGRSHPFALGEYTNVSYIDVNSLYPYIMRSIGTINHPELTTSYKGTGFYHIRANVPATVPVAPLPYKAKHGGLWFPVGRFETVASSLEIDIALELGCQIDVISGYHFAEQDTETFKAFVDKCESLRKMDYSGGLGITAKFTQNNCYGYLGMRPDREELTISASMPDFEEGTQEWSQYIDELGNPVETLWTRTCAEDKPNIVPAWAAWITAGARAYLLRALLAEIAAGNQVLMCDTDSIFLRGCPVSPLHPTQYGAFKIEALFDRFVSVAAKCYLGHSVQNPKPMMKCKGIPRKLLAPDNYDRILTGEKVIHHFTQVNSFSKVLAGEPYGIQSVYRSMPTLDSATNMLPQGIGEKCLPIRLAEW